MNTEQLCEWMREAALIKYATVIACECSSSSSSARSVCVRARERPHKTQYGRKFTWMLLPPPPPPLLLLLPMLTNGEFA